MPFASAAAVTSESVELTSIPRSTLRSVVTGGCGGRMATEGAEADSSVVRTPAAPCGGAGGAPRACGSARS